MGPKLKEPSPARRRRVEIMLQGWASFDHQSEIGFISADLPKSDRCIFTWWDTAA